MKAAAASKVPTITVGFWLIKILATTLGETGGDALSMRLQLGYLASTVIFFGLFAVAVTLQVAAERYRPWVYWLCVVSTTTVGTTLSDYCDRSLGLGYLRSSALLLAAVAVTLALWRYRNGRIVFEGITQRSDERFYWLTILIANTLGTALGDFTADDLGFGFQGGALLFAGLLAAVAALHRWTNTSRPLLFWAAYVLTRPLGATLGDTLTKPLTHGGFALDQIQASLTIAAIMAAAIVWWTRAGREREPRT